MKNSIFAYATIDRISTNLPGELVYTIKKAPKRYFVFMNSP